jgi:peptidoglycan/xylan/chitin deacetylase (PgdA/CDA1 family)
MIATYVVVGILLAWFVLPYAISKGQVFSLVRQCRKRRAIVMTYDDGPGSTITDRLMALLESYRLSATFFPLGWKLEEVKPPELRHELGSHSYRHLHAWKKSPVAVYRDIDRGLNLVSKYSSSRLFRPPYGKVTLATLAQLWLKKYRLALWTIDSSDTWATPVSIAEVINRIREDGGGVILMHDHDRPNDIGRETYVLELTQAILEFSSREGFKVCSMGEILDT